MVKDVEDPLGTRGGLLRHGNDAAHRIEACIKAADIGQEGNQHAHRDGAMRYLPDAEHPDDQQPDLGQQRHGRREQRPYRVDTVVDGQVVLVGLAKARHFALFLRESLDHADTRDGVGQHVGDLRPDAVDLLEAVPQAIAHQVDHPGDERQRHQRHQRQPGVDRDQDHRRHDDHQHVGGEVQQVQGQEHADAVAFRADARHQVAGALAAEILQRQLKQMFVRRYTQIRTDALGYTRQQIGTRPSETPCHQRGTEQPPQVHAHEIVVDRHPVLVRNQHLVHQRHGQVRRYQRGAGGQHRQHETGQQLPAVRLGKAPQAQQRPGRRRRFQLAVALGALLFIRRQRRLAGRARHFAWLAHSGRGGGIAAHLELVGQPQRGRIVTKRISPAGQPARWAGQFEGADPRMIRMGKAQLGRDGPFPHIFFTRRPGDDALVRHNQPPLGKMQPRVEVQNQSGQDVLAGTEPRSGFGTPRLVGSGGVEGRQGGLGHGWRGMQRPGEKDIT
ncbi:hypothetical protein D9M70_443900 [compost metagenome]